MKKTLILTVGAVLLMSSCSTYAGAGAYTGSSLGSILGSAIGGITGGPRGSDIGTIVGMAGGAVIGGAIGAKADQKVEERHQQYVESQRDDVHEHYQKVMANRERRRGYDSYDSGGYGSGGGYGTDSGFDVSGSGDDRIYDFGSSDYVSDYSASSARVEIPTSDRYDYAQELEIRNARFVDDDMDNTLSRGELCKIIFEVYNRGNVAMNNVVPVVEETNGNKHIYVSPSVHVERIAPGRGIRYTALVKADKSLKNGEANFRIYAVQDDRNISSYQLFTVKTRK